MAKLVSQMTPEEHEAHKARKREQARAMRATPEGRARANANAVSWYRRNPDKARASLRASRKKNREKRKAYLDANRERNRAYQCDYYRQVTRKNKPRSPLRRPLSRETRALLERARRANNWARRKATKLRACPTWVDRDQLRGIYVAAQILRAQGHDVHVDHIIPLRGETVSGLHVPWNLQILPARENLRKGNRHAD
jgi:hypothetical protein